MKFKRVLKEVRWERSYADAMEGVKKGIRYNIDGKEVSKKVFEREKRRWCLYVRKYSTSFSGRLENIIYGKETARGKYFSDVTEISQYIPLPFYHPN